MADTTSFNRRIDIAMDIQLLDAVDAGARRHVTTRSAVIRQALREWVERESPTATTAVPAQNSMWAEKPSFHALIKPGMGPDELLTLLQDYEAGRYNIQ
jgi:Arc/MetJ-type ribon-helix-helix transcriptional regulator